MYFQKDYILRMIEMFGKLFEDLVNRTEWADALHEIDQIALKACGLPASMLLGVDPEDIRGLLSDLQRYFAAELLMIELAVQRRFMTEDELFPREVQILEILATLEEVDYVIPACDHVWRIVGECDEYDGPLRVDLLIAIAGLFERGGQYDHAEDMLYAVMERVKENAEADLTTEAVKEMIRSFYQRLLKMDDRALLAGGLPRDEVEEGMREVDG